MWVFLEKSYSVSIMRQPGWGEARRGEAGKNYPYSIMVLQIFPKPLKNPFTCIPYPSTCSIRGGTGRVPENTRPIAIPNYISHW